MKREAARLAEPGVQGVEGAAAAGEKAAAASPARADALGGDRVWLVCALLAAVLVVLGSFLPLWKMVLTAPQYSDGLRMVAYGSRMTGDLREINSLNHYVGIRAIDPDTVRELDLFLPTMVLLTAALLVAAFKPRIRKVPLRWLVAIGVWAIPIGFLIDLQYWLYDFGHELDPHAPIRIDEFTPRVLGPTDIVNFHSTAMVSWGFWCFVAAGLLLTLGPVTVRFLRETWANTGTAEGTKALAAAAFIVPLTTIPGIGPEPALDPASAVSDVQAAIDAATAGETVVIHGGTHHGPLIVDKSITLIGEDRPVIDGDGADEVVLISGDGVTFRGFVVQGTSMAYSREPSAIHVTGNRAVIEDNEVRDSLYGIFLADGGGHIVRGNTVASLLDLPSQLRGHALYLWNSSNNTIEDNRILGAKDGIFMGFSNFNHFTGNTAENVRYGIHYMYADDNVFRGNRVTNSTAGAAVMYSRRVTLDGNEFAYNRSKASGYGILLKDVDDLTIVNNLIHHNRLGLTMEGAPFEPDTFVRLTGNLIGYNQTALEITGTVDAEFSENSFVGNLEQVAVAGTHVKVHNSWAMNGRGNYWDDYRGFDANGDGLGDIEYRYEGAFNDLVENHPPLQAFRHTLAQSALDLTARWFPLYTPQERVMDPAPLMAPTVELKNNAGGAQRAVGLALGAALILLPTAAAWNIRRSFTPRPA